MDRNNDASPAERRSHLPLRAVVAHTTRKDGVALGSSHAPRCPARISQSQKKASTLLGTTGPRLPGTPGRRSIQHPPPSSPARSAERGVSANGLFLRPPCEGL